MSMAIENCVICIDEFCWFDKMLCMVVFYYLLFSEVEVIIFVKSYN